jgi:hypothetical protein
MKPVPEFFDVFANPSYLFAALNLVIVISIIRIVAALTTRLECFFGFVFKRETV